MKQNKIELSTLYPTTHTLHLYRLYLADKSSQRDDFHSEPNKRNNSNGQQYKQKRKAGEERERLVRSSLIKNIANDTSLLISLEAAR